MKQQLGKWVFFVGSTAIVLLLAAWYPALQRRFPALQGRTLAGAFNLTEAPRFTPAAWLEGTYQQQVSRALKENPSIRPFLVRLKNEYLFHLFHTEAHPVLEIGQNGYLFDRTYIRASLGLDYKGDAYIARQADQLHQLNDFLNSRGKKLLILMPPSKAAHIPENIPPAYEGAQAALSNRQALARAFREKGIPYIDFSHLREEEKKRGWPMYPPTGLHWSHYGATLAADTLARFAERLLGIQMPQLTIASLMLTDQLRPPDNEFGELLNLLSPYPYDTMAYPVVRYNTDSLTVRPNVLIVGDSFYRVLYDLGFQHALFDPDSKYWHYFERHILMENEDGVAIDKSPEHLHKVLAETDLVLYVASATNLHRLGFGFTEAVLTLE